MKPFNDCSSMEQDLIMKQKMLAMLREMDDYKNCISKICSNYIKMMDTKTANQDLKIAQAVAYLEENIIETSANVLTRLIEEGKITIDVLYDAETESLYIGGVLID